MGVVREKKRRRKKRLRDQRRCQEEKGLKWWYPDATRYENRAKRSEGEERRGGKMKRGKVDRERDKKDLRIARPAMPARW